MFFKYEHKIAARVFILFYLKKRALLQVDQKLFCLWICGAVTLMSVFKKRNDPTFKKIILI